MLFFRADSTLICAGVEASAGNRLTARLRIGVHAIGIRSNSRQTASRSAPVWVILSMAILSTACSSSITGAQATEDTTYLTPVPETTLAAYRPGSPIESRLQAVIAARASLATTRLRYAETPEVVWAEEMKLEDAHKRAAQPGVSTYEDRPGDTKVWLVVFEGEWQVIPPDPLHTVTPPPPSHGCAYVILDATDSGRNEIGTMDCLSGR